MSGSALAYAAGISPFHLIRLFSKQLGVTPHAYQISIRIQRAKELLRGRSPVAEIALQTGFYDQSQFTKVFKSHVGVTQGCYVVLV